jgi:segregation and condensation protein B
MSKSAKAKPAANAKTVAGGKSAASAAAATSDLGLDSFRKVPEDEGLSLDKLKGAFAAMLGAGDDPYSVPAEPEQDPLQSAIVVEEEPDASGRPPVDQACEVNPRSILEAMLFVGLPGNVPLTAQQVAGLMRGVRPAEIDELVRDLNTDYARSGRPYTIVSQGPGYRMTLREEFQGVRDRFLGRVRQAKLSQVAIEVLAIVAYNGPLSADEVSRQRGTPSGSVLAQLVRRQLLRLDRDAANPRAGKYSTTDRFLRLFGVESPADLPRTTDLERT